MLRNVLVVWPCIVCHGVSYRSCMCSLQHRRKCLKAYRPNLPETGLAAWAALKTPGWPMLVLTGSIPGEALSPPQVSQGQIPDVADRPLPVKMRSLLQSAEASRNACKPLLDALQ